MGWPNNERERERVCVCVCVFVSHRITSALKSSSISSVIPARKTPIKGRCQEENGVQTYFLDAIRKKRGGQPNMMGAPSAEPIIPWNALKNGMALATMNENNRSVEVRRNQCTRARKLVKSLAVSGAIRSCTASASGTFVRRYEVNTLNATRPPTICRKCGLVTASGAKPGSESPFARYLRGSNGVCTCARQP